jgi:soluble lytic murein transglycosylase-like protein
MRWLLDTFNGDVVLALAGYNAGEGACDEIRLEAFRRIAKPRNMYAGSPSRYSAISDGRVVQSARLVDGKLASTQRVRPLSVYEPDAVTVRLPDGQLMLVNQ